ADDPAHAQAKADLSRRLDAWMAQQGDQGNASEMNAAQRQGRAENPPKKKGAKAAPADDGDA
ncbi:MAG: hypothetical protein ISS74_10100, partial [Planctomycetes bacterium]|nr:hypothetical protein [Planctomycetota bacterium]